MKVKEPGQGKMWLVKLKAGSSRAQSWTSEMAKCPSQVREERHTECGVEHCSAERKRHLKVCMEQT